MWKAGTLKTLPALVVLPYIPDVTFLKLKNVILIKILTSPRQKTFRYSSGGIIPLQVHQPFGDK